MVLKDMDLGRLGNRRKLLDSFDSFRRSANSLRSVSSLDRLQQRAMDILTSNRLAEAFDLSKEDPKTLERYGKGDAKNFGDGAPRDNTHFLMARRLVEAGARCVTLNSVTSRPSACSAVATTWCAFSFAVSY
mgnify:CR=1 FL=1